MFYEAYPPATDHMQSNTEDKSIICSDTAAQALLTNSHTFCLSEISQMVSFLDQLWRFHPGFLQRHSPPGPGPHFALKLLKKRQQPFVNRQQGQKKRSNLTAGISATFLSH